MVPENLIFTRQQYQVDSSFVSFYYHSITYLVDQPPFDIKIEAKYKANYLLDIAQAFNYLSTLAYHKSIADKAFANIAIRLVIHLDYLFAAFKPFTTLD